VTLSVEQPTDRPPDVAPDKVILTIGDLQITASQFSQMIDTLPEQSREAARGAQRTQFATFLTQMVVLAQEAKRLNLDDTPVYRSEMLFQTDNTLAGLEYAQIGKSAKPDEAALRKYYDDHQADLTQARARHILVRFKGSPLPVRPDQQDLTEADALTRILELRKRIVAGEDFAEVAKKESDDTGTAAQGGDLGTFGKGQMVPAFEAAAFAMKPGDLSDPVKSQFGYHLIKLESKEVKSFADARADLERQLTQAAVQKAVEDLVNKTHVSVDPAYFPPKPNQ
jgi:parvulin-like peptidyl-prolyl isomerase